MKKNFAKQMKNYAMFSKNNRAKFQIKKTPFRSLFFVFVKIVDLNIKVFENSIKRFTKNYEKI